MQTRIDTAIEALDPAALATRLKLFEVEHDQVFESARREVEAGYKNDDWIWSVFPQAAALPERFGKSSSDTSRKFSILCFDEAVAFLEHPILGSHYLTIVKAVRDQLDQRGLKEIFRRDAKKVVSSVTLFRDAARVSLMPDPAVEMPDVQDQGDCQKTLVSETVNPNDPLDPLDRLADLAILDADPFSVEGWQYESPKYEPPKYAPPQYVEFLTAQGEVLFDHCDAILARADDENLESCSYSEHFDPLMETEFFWRRGVQFHDDEFPDDEPGGSLGWRPAVEGWRGNARDLPPLGGGQWTPGGPFKTGSPHSATG